MTDDELIHELSKLRRPALLRPRVVVAFPQTIERPASEEELKRAEQRLGIEIPPLLGRMLREIGNGGFGPGYGLLGVESGKRDARGDDLIGHYLFLRSAVEPREGEWPEGIVPLLSWGGGVFSCGVFRERDCPIVEFDPSRHRRREPTLRAFQSQAKSLNEFFSTWIQGKDVALA